MLKIEESTGKEQEGNAPIIKRNAGWLKFIKGMNSLCVYHVFCLF